MLAYQGVVENGQVRLEQGRVLPEGAQVIVVVMQDPAPDEVRGVTGAELLASGLVGLWADREDIGDCVGFARELRQKAERRDK
jgi:hypothetical protein